MIDQANLYHVATGLFLIGIATMSVVWAVAFCLAARRSS